MSSGPSLRSNVVQLAQSARVGKLEEDSQARISSLAGLFSPSSLSTLRSYTEPLIIT